LLAEPVELELLVSSLLPQAATPSASTAHALTASQLFDLTGVLLWLIP
jgi:hypothetical protein